MKEVYIISAVRTPIGSFGGSLASVSSVDLGAVAVRGALQKAGVDGKLVQEVFLGNVISAGLGQAPATQVAAAAGLGFEIPCTIVNKVCASGMKAVMLGAQSIMLRQNDVVVAGGMESMSNIPYYLLKARYGYRYGNGELIDGLQYDGLTDVYNHCNGRESFVDLIVVNVCFVDSGVFDRLGNGQGRRSGEPHGVLSCVGKTADLRQRFQVLFL